MARRLIQSDSVFLDSACAIALASATDQFHPEALALAEELEASGTRLLTTWAVLLEIGNALSKVQYRHAAIHPQTPAAICNGRQVGVCYGRAGT